MRSMLLGAAAAVSAAILPASQAQAQSQGNVGFTSSHGVTIHRGGGDGFRRGHHRGGNDEIRFTSPRDPRPDAVVVDWGMGYGGQWALYNNRTFEPDSYNDWWHERPWRAYPRWMGSNSCDRQWWGGGAWRCSW